MIAQHDRVVLTAPVPEERLEIGDVGTVVHVEQMARPSRWSSPPSIGHTAAVPTAPLRHFGDVLRRASERVAIAVSWPVSSTAVRFVSPCCCFSSAR
jgi:hypothetical protein